MKELTGVCVPICTPFDKSGEKLDETALKNHIDSMIEAGVHIILVCGGTGEFPYLRADEKRRIAEISAKHIDGRATFMVQTSAISTSETIEFTKHAEGVGADAVMVLPPYFEGPDIEGVHYHYEKVARSVKVPLMVYNIPQSSGINITPEFFSRLLEIDNIQYIKDSTADLTQIQALLGTGGKVFNGGDPITFQALLSGCPGCVWGAVNAMPKEAVELFNLVSANKLVEARDLWQRIFPAQLYFWNSVYNAAVKAATNMSGRPVGNCRLPVQPLSNEQLAGLSEALAPLGIGAAQQKIAV
ncbi:MAG: dihydrodipicolinate synthase family protein [Gammaproteobacteria bacterium]|nr:dihydrodipicolinate synthase family protein [Gammaproteobacteria bacterium]